MNQSKLIQPPVLLNRSTLVTLAVHIVAAAAALALASCAPAKWHETQATAHTGDPVAEAQTTQTTPQDLHPGFPGFVNPTRLRGFASPDQPEADVPVVLEQNDPIIVDDPTPQGKKQLVKVHVVKPDTEAPAGPMYIPAQYISSKKVVRAAGERDANRYFVVENIASEKLRVYERCTTGPDCAHKLILETDMIVGEETPDHERRSIVGSFTIDSWAKFYQDAAGLYPSWITPGAPIPASGSSLEAWTSMNLRGAFGWYTAKLRPDAREQWTHGTWGNGADGEKFILALEKGPYRADLRLASHGCTRVENQAIAYMHEILPAGTKLIKIYAKETVSQRPVTPLPEVTWSWLLTKEGAGRNGGTMTAGRVKAPRTEILDEGSYLPNQVATAAEFLPGVKRAQRKNGNVYDLPDTDLRGVFLVNEGRLQGYTHPRGIAKGGYIEKGAIPAILIAK